MRSIYKLVIPFLLLVSTIKSSAQVYPVNGTSVLIPPYSVYLSDYTSGTSDRLVLNVVLNDASRPELRVRLRMKIEGQNVKLETKPEYIGSEIILQGGVPLRLSGTDLIEYFNPNTLNFSGISRREFEKSGALPQGFYTFCFEVLEYNRGVKISNTICAPGWLILNDPPIVNLPRNNEKVKPMLPQNFVMQWTPRHTGSPNSAFGTEYEIKMVEVWPATRNPNDAILTSPPILETTTRSTTFIYGPAETPLELGRKYAFRIRAKSIVGAEELDLFKNNGYSEVVTFVYGDACDVPDNIQIETAATKFTVKWAGRSNHSEYMFRYRAAGSDTWYESKTAINEVSIYSLKPNTTYEYQIAGQCGIFGGQYTQVATIKTNDVGAATYSCGLPVENFNLDPAQLIDLLKVGDVIQAGDFEVKLAKVSGSNGTFSGEGVIEVPFFNKAKVKAEFTSIAVNKEMRMVSGFMNVTGAGVEVIPSGVMDLMDDLTETLDQLDSALNTIEANLPQPFDEHSFVPDVTLNVPGPVIVNTEADGSVVVTDANGVDHRLPAGQETAIVDDKGNATFIDSKGKDHPVSAAVAATAIKREYNLNLIFAEADNSRYGFDAKKYKELETKYDKLNDNYFVPFKSVETGKTDAVVATLGGSGIDKTKIRFESGGVPLSSTPFSGDKSTITVQGKSDGEQEGLIAVYPAADANQKDQVLGRVNVVTYNAMNKVLYVVPVNGNTYSFGSAQSLQTELNKIYGQAVVNWTVNIAQGINVPDISPFDVGSSGMLSNYTDHMKKVINEYKANMSDNEDTYYLFLVNNSSNKEINGFMPRSKQAGFILKDGHATEGAIARTMAHELGHGAFNLHHTFMEEGFPIPEKTTDNLMDYANGTKLYKYQWDKMRYPAIVIGLFESDAEGASAAAVALQALSEEDLGNLSDDVFLGLTPTGKIIGKATKSGERLIATISEASPYVIMGFQAFDTENKLMRIYRWKAGSFADESGENKVDIEFRASGKVRVYLPFLTGCLYKVQTIDWSESIDAPDMIAKIQGKIREADWKPTSYFQPNPSCNNEFVKQIVAHDESDECADVSKINSDKSKLISFLNGGTDDDLVRTINSVCKSSIVAIGYSNIETLFSRLGSSNSIKNKKEIAILRLASAVSTDDFGKFYDLLAKNNNYLLRNLISQMDDNFLFPFGKDNYTNFIGALCWMFQYNNRISEIGDESDIALLGKIISLKPYKFKETSWASLYTGNKRFNSSYDGSTGKITVFEEEGKIVSGMGGDGGESWQKIGDDFPAVSPLTPVIIVLDHEDLPLLQTALEGAPNLGSSQYVVPAIFLEYRSDRFQRDVAEKTVMVTLDAVTIYASGGTALATKVGWARRLWAMTEVAGAVGNIAVNTGAIKQGDKLYTVVEIYNGVMLLVGAKNLASSAPGAVKGVYQFAKNLSAEAKTVLNGNKNIKAVLTAAYINWRAEVAKLTDLTSAEKQLIAEQEEVWKRLGAEASSAVAYADIFDLSVFKNLASRTPTGSNLTTLKKSEFVTHGYKVKPTAGPLKSSIDDIIANGDNLGSKTEGIVDEILAGNGYAKLDGKYGSNNGYDGVYIKGTYENPTEIIIVESKQFKYTSGAADEIIEHSGITLNPPSATTPLPAQMSDSWVQYVANKLRDAGKTEIADMIIDNPALINKYVSAVDKIEGEINFLKLSSY